jgi:hypothetical protein
MNPISLGSGRIWLVAAILASALVGCGGDDAADDAAAETPPPAAAPPAAPPAGAPQAKLKSAADVGSPLAAAELDAVVAGTTAAGLAGAARCDVQLVDITYRTTAPDGATPTETSGVVMVPKGPACPGPFPLVAYSRGTDIDKSRALGTPGDEEARLVAALLASQGFVVAATDYLGYARSPWPYHPYLHAGSEASSNVDAMRAAREVATQRGVPLNGKVFLTGYSQGGHASLATQKLVEGSLSAEFALAGAGHMSGPYDLVTSVQEALARLPLGDLGSTYYIPFTTTALQKVYGNIYTTPREFFKSPYDETIESTFPSPPGVKLEDLIAQNRLPVLLSGLVTDDFVKAALDEQSNFHRALAANSPIDFVPKARTLFCGGSRDPVVSYKNTERAVAAFQAAGAPGLALFDVEEEPTYSALLRDDVLPVEVDVQYHASLVPPLCLLQVRKSFQTP